MVNNIILHNPKNQAERLYNNATATTMAPVAEEGGEREGEREVEGEVEGERGG